MPPEPPKMFACLLSHIHLLLQNLLTTLRHNISKKMVSCINVFGSLLMYRILGQCYCTLVIYTNHNTTIYVLCMVHKRTRFLRYKASCTQIERAIYSASQLDKATTFCFLLFHDMKLLSLFN